VKRCSFRPPTPGYGPCTRERGHSGPCAHHAVPRRQRPRWLRLCIDLGFWAGFAGVIVNVLAIAITAHMPQLAVERGQFIASTMLCAVGALFCWLADSDSAVRRK